MHERRTMRVTDEHKLEEIMNMTYPGLKLLNRDTSMRRVGEKYELGAVLRDEREVRGSFIGGGLAGMDRYAILSNRINVAQSGEPGWEWAMGSIDAGGYYKVLDVYRRLGKAQITLLHLPDEHWRHFLDLSTNVDDLLVEYTRRRFDQSLDMAPDSALGDERWRKMCIHLVGMTDLGQKFPLESA